MNKVSAFALTFSALLLPLLGMISPISDFLGDMGREVLNPVGQVPAMAYFSPESLKGAVISLCIGCVLYFLVVRLFLMKKKEGGTVYVNRWYRYLDLEEYVYRPVLQKALPFVLGIICRILDSLVDSLVILLRKTIYRDSPLPHELEEGNALTHGLGHFADSLEKVANVLFRRKQPRETDHVHRYAVVYEQWSENVTIIARSLSFGLLLFCAGLIVTVVYLLIY